MLAFSLSQLVQLKIKELSGTIFSRKHKIDLPVWQVYEDVMAALHRKDFEGNDVMLPVREKLFGKDWFKGAPQEYWDTLMVMDLGYELSQWRDTSIDDKATILAVRYLKNMVETITAYYEDQEERLKNMGQKKND